MGFRKIELKGAVILKAFNSEDLQNAIFAVSNQYDIIDLQYSTTNLTNRQSSALVEYSALILLGEKLEAKETPEKAAAQDAARVRDEPVLPTSSSKSDLEPQHANILDYEAKASKEAK